jgi:hypothetical protein
MNHRIGRIVFVVGMSLLVATMSYQWISNPEGREERALEISIVEASRSQLMSIIDARSLEIVDPLTPNRKVGKVYIYPEDQGWAISGYYRRGPDDRWHPYLMMLGADRRISLLKLKDQDQRLVEQAAADPRLEVSP